MGYYKNTMYTGPNAEDHSDRSPEALAERRTPRQYRGLGSFDNPTCWVCETPAPEGQVWVDGLCGDCKALAAEV